MKYAISIASRFEQVSREYRSTISCDSLELAWAQALRDAHRPFVIANSPHSFGASGSLEIRITDQSHALGVTIGTDDGHCEIPFVYSFNRPQ